jgi:hypothetical protein
MQFLLGLWERLTTFFRRAIIANDNKRRGHVQQEQKPEHTVRSPRDTVPMNFVIVIGQIMLNESLCVVLGQRKIRTGST